MEYIILRMKQIRESSAKGRVLYLMIKTAPFWAMAMIYLQPLQVIWFVIKMILTILAVLGCMIDVVLLVDRIVGKERGQ